MKEKEVNLRNLFSYYRGEGNPDGAIMPKSEVHISPNDRGFVFADGVYEVIRTYSGKLFRLEQHLVRLQRSLSGVRIVVPDVNAIGDIARELIARNGLQKVDATVYIQITRGVCPRAHAFPCVPVLPTIYVETNRLVPMTDGMSKGVGAITVPDIRWGRVDIKSIALLPNVLARQQAVEQGVYEAGS